MALSIKELEAGIDFWKEKKPSWDKNFHNQFYKYMSGRIKELMPNADFNPKWGEWFFGELYGWRADRGKSRSYLMQQLKERSFTLAAIWKKDIAPNLDPGKDITEVEWDVISAFTEEVRAIKGVESPVFTSKFCHFLAPRIFPVADNEAMGKGNTKYEKYYKEAQYEWNATDADTLQKMEALLVKKIGSQAKYKHYPIECKLIELSLTGRYQTKKRYR